MRSYEIPIGKHVPFMVPFTLLAPSIMSSGDSKLYKKYTHAAKVCGKSTNALMKHVKKTIYSPSTYICSHDNDPNNMVLKGKTHLSSKIKKQSIYLVPFCTSTIGRLALLEIKQLIHVDETNGALIFPHIATPLSVFNGSVTVGDFCLSYLLHMKPLLVVGDHSDHWTPQSES